MDNNKLLTEIIKNNLVETVFQPVADLNDGRAIGYEALSRGPEGTEFHMPLPLISQAKSYNRTVELDELLCTNTLRNARSRGLTGLLFLNLDACFLLENRKPAGYLLHQLSECGIPASDVVIEFTEKSAVCRFDSFINTMSQYREAGFLLSFDNVGPAYTNLFTVGKLRPDFIKIDRHMTESIAMDPDKREKLKTEMMIAGVTGSRLIAEGVETKEDLVTLIEMGVGAAQGHFIGQPNKNFAKISPDALTVIQSRAQTGIA